MAGRALIEDGDYIISSSPLSSSIFLHFDD
jgi:hypothetical protein